MNSSVPLVSPPLITAAATRMPAITPSIAQNSVVLGAALVSVLRRRTEMPVAPLGALVVADSIYFLLLGFISTKCPRVKRAPARRPECAPHASGYMDLPRYSWPKPRLGQATEPAALGSDGRR